MEQELPYEERLKAKGQAWNDLRDAARRHIYEHKELYKGEGGDFLVNWRIAYECIDECNLEQLWALYYRFIRHNTPFTVVSYADYLGIIVHTMFVGIELDGYTHS